VRPDGTGAGTGVTRVDDEAGALGEAHIVDIVVVGVHHWSRQLQALGHTVRLMPPAYVKPYVKRQKNDAADAEAICEAVTRPNMRFVPTKTPEQQSCGQMNNWIACPRWRPIL
jgi:hypothetical protein